MSTGSRPRISLQPRTRPAGAHLGHGNALPGGRRILFALKKNMTGATWPAILHSRSNPRGGVSAMDVSPDKQDIEHVFSNTAYYIDFYQREYRWTDEPVLRLLDDIFHRFKEQYARSPELDPSKETITA